jgi:hypothetical protein
MLHCLGAIAHSRQQHYSLNSIFLTAFLQRYFFPISSTAFSQQHYFFNSISSTPFPQQHCFLNSLMPHLPGSSSAQQTTALFPQQLFINSIFLTAFP